MSLNTNLNVISDERNPHVKLHIHVPTNLEPQAARQASTLSSQLAKELFSIIPSTTRSNPHITLRPEEISQKQDQINSWIQKKVKQVITQQMTDLVYVRNPPSQSVGEIDIKSAVEPVTKAKPRKVITKEEEFNSRIANIIGDAFIGSSGYEGHSKLTMMKHAKNWLESNITKLSLKYSKTDIANLRTLLEQLKRGIALQEKFPDVNPTGKEVADAAKAISETLSKLTPEDEGILLGGGYVGEPFGHAVYYVITRNKDKEGTFRFEVYNTGAGINYHHSESFATPHAPERQPKLKTLYSTKLVLDKILPERMTSTIFWRTSLELLSYTKIPADVMKGTESESPTNYVPEEIYGRLLPFLHGEPCTSFTKEEFSLKQSSGTCSWTGLFRGAIKSKVSEPCFDRLEYEIELNALEELSESYKDTQKLAKTQKTISLLDKGYKYLSSKVKSFHSKNVITLEEFEKTNLFLKKVENQVQKAQEIAEKERSSTAPKVTFGPINQPFYDELPADIDVKALNPENVAQPKAMTLFWNGNWKPNVKSIRKDLSEFCKICNTKAKQEPRAVTYCIAELLMQLPMPQPIHDPFWNAVLEPEIESCMTSLATLSELLTQCCFESHADTLSEKRTELIVALHKALAIQHRLACNSKEMQDRKVDTWKMEMYDLHKCFNLYTLGSSSGGRSQIFARTVNEQFGLVLNYFQKTRPESNPLEFFNSAAYESGVQSAEQSCSIDIKNEQSFAYKFYVDHRKKFDATMRKQMIASLGKKDDANFTDEMCATYALTDLEGLFFPKTFCMLKKQALIATLFLRGNRFNLKCNFLTENNKCSVQIPVLARPEIVGPKKLIKKEDDRSKYTFQSVNDYLNKDLALLEAPDYMHLAYTAENAKVKNLSESEVVEWLSLKSGVFHEGKSVPEELKIVKAIHYFSDKIHKLADHDTQCFLNDIIFDGNNLSKCINDSPSFATFFFAFIHRGYLEFKQRSNIPTATYMLFLGQTLKEHLHARESKLKKTLLEQFEKELNTELCLKDLLKQTKNTTEKAVVYRQLVAEYALLNEKELYAKIAEAVAALTYLEASSIPPEHQNGHLAYVVDRLRITIQPALKSIIKNSQQCTQIVKAASLTLIEGSDKLAWERMTWKIYTPICIGSIDGKEQCYFNYQDFVLSQKNQKKIYLPNSITSQEAFKLNFPDQYYAQAVTNGLGFYEIENKSERIRLQKVSDTEMTIQRQFTKNGPWYTYQPEDKFEKSIFSQILRNECTFWVTCDNPGEILLLKKGTNFIQHRMIASKHDPKKFTIIDEKNPHRILLKTFSGDTLKALSNFETPDYIHTWINSKSGEPETIEMPRLKLSFDLEHSGKPRVLAKCREITGFYIAEKQYVKGLDSFKDYLVLQNNAGITKVIISDKMISYSNSCGGLDPKIALIATYEKSLHYFEYVVKQDGSLKPLHDRGNLHLAYILLGLRKYEEAQVRFRDSSNRLKRYQENDLETLRRITQLNNLKDNHPKSSAVFLTAAVVFVKSFQIHGMESKYLQLESLKTAYLKYVETQEFVGDTILTFEEELTIVKALARKNTDSFFKARLDFLQKNTIQPIAYDPKTYLPTYEPIRENTGEGIQNAVIQALGKDRSKETAPFDGLFLSQFVQNRSLDFRASYIAAKKVPPEKRFETAQMYEQAGIFRKNIQLYGFLAAVVCKPELFPDFEELEEGKPRPYRSVPHSEKFTPWMESAAKIFNEFRKLKKRATNQPFEFDKMLLQSDVKAIAEVETYSTTSLKNESLSLLPPPSLGPKHHFENLFVPIPQNESFQKRAIELNQVLAKQEADVKHQSSKLQKLTKDIAFHTTQKPKIECQLKLLSNKQSLLVKLKETYQQIEESRNGSIGISKELETLILKIANKIPDSKELDLKARRLRENYLSDLLSGNKNPFKMDDLCIAMLRNDRNDFRNRNPFLLESDIATIHTLLTNYLLRCTVEQRLLRQVSALKAIETHIQSSNSDLRTDLALQELTNKSVHELTQTRADPTNNLALLIFETYCEITLRDDQVKNLLKLKNNPHIILQMIMGSGKSKVLLPLLALSIADGDTLPLIIVPQPLFASMSTDLRNSFGGAFKGVVQTRAFSRNTQFTVELLTDLWDQLNEIRKNKQCLMMTSKSVACLLLKFKEALILFAGKPNDTELRQKVELLKKILNLFGEKGKAIIDEADSILNARLETNFTLFNADGVKSHLRNLVKTLYIQLRSEEIKKIIGSDPLSSYTLLPDEYHLKVKPELAKKMLSVEPLAAFVKSIQPDLKQIQMYLEGVADENVDNYVSSLRTNHAQFTDLLALLKEELNTLLPLTLSKRFCVDYGPSKRQQRTGRSLRSLAIPYNGNDSPVENSEFRSADIIMNYTLQSCWKTGIYASDVLAFVKRLQDQAIQEKAIKGFKSILETEAFRTFKNLCGNQLEISFLDANLSDCQKICNCINAFRDTDQNAFFDFVSENILSQIKIYSNQITCSAIDVVGLFKSTIGFSGTPWNSETYAERLRKSTEIAEGVDGKTAILLYAKTQQPDGIRTFKKTTKFPELLDELIRIQDDALIDTGAIFNGQPHENVAQAILSLLQKRNSKKLGVVFFQKDAAAVLEIVKVDNHVVGTRIIPLSQSCLKPEELFVYFDQAHTTGSDIQLPLIAQATQTIGKDDKVRDLFQGAWRLRGIDKQQSVSLMLMPESEMHMRKAFNLNQNVVFSFVQVLQFVIQNEEKELLDHLKLSTKQKVDFVLHQEILKALLQLDLSSDVKGNESAKLVEQLRAILISTLSHNPFDLYGKRDSKIDKEIIIQQLCTNVTNCLKAIPSDSLLFKGNRDAFISKVLDRIDEELGNSIDLLPKKLSAHMVSAKNNDGEVQMEQQKEQQELSEKEMQQLMQRQKVGSAQLEHRTNYWWQHKGQISENQLNNFAPPLFQSTLHTSKRIPREQVLKLIFDDDIATPDYPEVFDLQTEVYETNPALKRFAALSQGLKASSNRAALQNSEEFEMGKAKALRNLHIRAQLPDNFVLFIYDVMTKKMALQFLDISDLNYFWTALSLDQKQKYPNITSRSVALAMSNLNMEILHHDSSVELTNVNPFYIALKEQGAALLVQAKLVLGEVLYSENELLHLQGLIKTHGRELICDYLREQIFPRNVRNLCLFIGSPFYKLLGEPSWAKEMYGVAAANLKK